VGGGLKPRKFGLEIAHKTEQNGEKRRMTLGREKKSFGVDLVIINPEMEQLSV
jgi:hypothetical protein